MVRNGSRIARIVDVTMLEVNGKKSYHASDNRATNARITKRLFDDLNWFAADSDTMRVVVYDARIVRSKVLYIPEYNNGGVLDRLDQYWKRG